MNKRGAEKIISVYWFVMLILVAGGIYGMVYMFYSHPFDVREIEANVLTNNIADCISEKGVINNELFNEGGSVKEDFLETCKINFNVEDEKGWDRDEQYFVRVQFFNVSSLQTPFAEISKGNEKWLSDCDINKKGVFDILEKCVEKRFYSVDGNKQILVDILSIVRKTEKNVKQ